MKTRFLILLSLIFFSFLSNAQQNTDSNYYYYYQGEKVYLSTRTDKMLVKLVNNANRYRLNNLIITDDTIEVDNNLINDTLNSFIILKAKANRIITTSTINKYKSSPDVAYSSSFLEYDNSGVMQGLIGEFIVKLKPTTTIAQLQSLITYYNCIIEEESEFEPNQFLISTSLQSNYNAMQLSNIFYETNLFEFSTPNFLLTNIFQSNDEYYSNQWGLNNDGQNGGVSGVDIKAEKAWTITQGNSNIRVAVVDEGVDLTHPDLAANILPGYDATGGGTGGAPDSDEKHGTACAGIIAAIKDNGIGISGVAPNCKILPAHASFGKNNTNYCLSQCINWARTSGADVISNSWGGGSPNDAITNAVNRAANEGRNNKGCVIVFASGNQNKDGVEYPSKLSEVIAVGAVDRCGIRSGRIDIVPNSCDPWGNNSKPGSSYGSGLYVVAPGTNVWTTDKQIGGYSTGNYYSSFGGTSAACPFVAGVAALMLSVNPDLTQQQVKYIISSSAQKVGGYDYQTLNYATYGTWNSQTGYGLVNAYAAVKAAQCYNDEPILENIIATNTAINTNTFGVGDITIRSGNTLTVTSTLSLAPEAKIIVEPNAKLIVNGGKITSACPNEFWGAIFVKGNKNQPQTEQYQGYVELNNATIENATNAISTWYPDNWNTTGGIIKANNTTFRNNLRSVEFMSYHNLNSSGNEMPNQSYFTNCTFVWDENLFANDKTELSHVTMWDVNKVKFTKCYFSKADEYKEDNTILTHGIMSELSGFNVSGLFSSQDNNIVFEKSKFSNLTYGIRAENLENKIFSVISSVFDTNFCGVFSSKANTFSVTGCDFNIRPDFEPSVNPNVDYIKTAAIGIFSNVSTGYTIANNNFYGLSFPMYSVPPGNTVGVGIQNSGEDPNAVNNNTFVNLYGGSQALGKNRSENDKVKVGLKYYCNNFENSMYGFYVTKYNTNDPNIYGICEEQRTLSVPALNFFNDNMTDICNKNCPKIFYSYSSNISNTNPTLCNTNVIPIDIQTEENNCGIIGDRTTREDWYTYKEALESQYVLLLYNYNNLLDGGQTDVLLDKLSDDWNGDIWDLRNDYLNNSPYLSVEVLKEMVQSEKLPLAVCTEILLSNPEATQKDEFKEFIYNEQTYLNPLAISLIEESWENKTFRASVESNLSDKFTELENASRAIIDIVLNDTTGININEYRGVLSEMRTTTSKFELADSYIGKQEYSSARNVLINLQENENYAEEINDYLQYINEIEKVENPYNLSQEVLSNLAEHNTIVGRKAKSMLYFKGINTDYHPIVLNMEDDPEEKSVRIKGSLSDLASIAITISPNPAKDYISLTYDLPTKQIYTLKIYDNKGIELFAETLNGNKGMQTIDLKNFSSGLYYYNVTNNKGIIKSDKLIIVK